MKRILLILIVLSTLQGFSQTPKTRILFLLDASGSMYARMGQDTRITVAKRLLSKLVDSLDQIPEVEIALRVYGHQSDKRERNCKDTKLEVPFSQNNKAQIKSTLLDLRPRGTTLIAYSLEQAAYDFPTNPNVRNVIILMTDGIEECDGDPCAVSEALQKQGVVLRPFIIGLGLSEEFRAQFDCVGRFFEAQTEDDFRDVLNVVISQAINNTTLQVNLLDKYGRPTETDVNMTFTDSKTGRIMYNFVHTMDYRGNPDTMYIDPSYSYDIKVHSIPPQFKKDIKLVPGIHNTIGIDAPQGTLNLSVDGVTKYANLQCLIIDPKTGEIVNVQSFNEKDRYIVGKYDLEILSLPRISQKAVSIDQSKSTTVQIPQPGKLNLISRPKLEAALYKKIEGELVLIENLHLDRDQNIIVMQPGTYLLIYRETAIKETLKTKERQFDISSGQTTQIQIN